MAVKRNFVWLFTFWSRYWMKQIIRSWTAISVRSSRRNPIHLADCASVKKDLQTASPNVSIIPLCTHWLLCWKYLFYSLSCNNTGLWRCAAFLMDISSFIRKYKLSIIVSNCTTELCGLVLRCPDSADDLNLTEGLEENLLCLFWLEWALCLLHRMHCTPPSTKTGHQYLQTVQ